MLKKIFAAFFVSCFIFLHAVAAETVAEKEKQRQVAQIKKNFEETLKATPTSLTGQVLLPEGKPASGMKIGGWGRSITHPGYGHFLFDTVTDQDGKFALALYRPCQYWITVDDPNHVYVTPDQYFELKDEPDAKPLTFSLQKGVPIEGVVRDRDKDEPLANMSLWLLPAPDYKRDLSREERLEREKKARIPREIATDAEGKFQVAGLPMPYLLSFDLLADNEKPSEEDAALYTRTFTAAEESLRFEFDIPAPWTGTLLQKDGTPAAFFPVNIGYWFWNGSGYIEAVTDNDGKFTVYKPIKLFRLYAGSLEANQWLYKSFKKDETLPPNAVFKMYTPLTASGRLVRKSTGEPMKNFKFLCSPSWGERDGVTTDDTGHFEIRGIYWNRETTLEFINPPDDNSCSITADFKTFTPTVPDQKIELGTIELEESGRLDPDTLQNLPGNTIEIEGVTLDGQELDWKNYQGKVVLVEFWATWCGPCLEELPHLKDVYEKYRDRGFEIVGISIDTDLSALEKGLEKHKFPWPVLADQKWKDAGNVRMYDRFSIRGVPRGLLVDRNGKIVTIETRSEKLDAELKKLFPEE